MLFCVPIQPHRRCVCVFVFVGVEEKPNEENNSEAIENVDKRRRSTIMLKCLCIDAEEVVLNFKKVKQTYFIIKFTVNCWMPINDFVVSADAIASTVIFLWISKFRELSPQNPLFIEMTTNDTERKMQIPFKFVDETLRDWFEWARETRAWSERRKICCRMVRWKEIGWTWIFLVSFSLQSRRSIECDQLQSIIDLLCIARAFVPLFSTCEHLQNNHALDFDSFSYPITSLRQFFLFILCFFTSFQNATICRLI